MLASGAQAALTPMDESELSSVTGQALIVSDRLAGPASGVSSNHSFYRMLMDVDIELNMNIDRLQLGCGGYNEGTTANVCDIDLEYVRLMGLGAGQPGAPGAGDPAVSSFKLNRPYIEIAVKNDGDATLREIVGFKIGSARTEGYFGIGRYDSSLPGCDPSAVAGQAAFMCHRGINRFSGFMNARLEGGAYGCFALFGCSVDGVAPEDQDLVATFDTIIQVYGTRWNRVITQITATSTDTGFEVGVDLNQHLRFLHGFALDPSRPQYAADDFFLSFQREQVRYPTYNKSQSHSFAANPGWWMNTPLAELTGLKAYDVEASSGSLFANTDLTDPEIGQRPPDNCFGSLTFC